MCELFHVPAGFPTVHVNDKDSDSEDVDKAHRTFCLTYLPCSGRSNTIYRAFVSFPSFVCFVFKPPGDRAVHRDFPGSRLRRDERASCSQRFRFSAT